jgi:hypothetical protein
MSQSAQGMDYALSVKEQLQNMCDMLSSASGDGTKHSTGKKEGEHRKKRKRRCPSPFLSHLKCKSDHLLIHAAEIFSLIGVIQMEKTK